LTADFESGSKVSLPISANALRVLEDGGARVRDLPQRTGVSKEAISTSLGVLERRGYVVIEPDAELRRTKVARLTTKGLDARAGYLPGLDGVEASWRARFDPTVDAVRDALEALLGAATASPPWLGGLEPYPDGWRSGPPEVLPHYPMVLHRGGFPDGA
jgi:DNA-binding MarR family transcriptional regulator